VNVKGGSAQLLSPWNPINTHCGGGSPTTLGLHAGGLGDLGGLQEHHGFVFRASSGGGLVLPRQSTVCAGRPLPVYQSPLEDT
jgi:hypothetical protein